MKKIVLVLLLCLSISSVVLADNGGGENPTINSGLLYAYHPDTVYDKDKVYKGVVMGVESKNCNLVHSANDPHHESREFVSDLQVTLYFKELGITKKLYTNSSYFHSTNLGSTVYCMLCECDYCGGSMSYIGDSPDVSGYLSVLKK